MRLVAVAMGLAPKARARFGRDLIKAGRVILGFSSGASSLSNSPPPVPPEPLGPARPFLPESRN